MSGSTDEDIKNINQHDCIVIVDAYVLLFLFIFFENPLIGKILFQDDNCQVQPAIINTDWFEKHSTKLCHILGPENPTDLQPTENLCDYLKLQIKHINRHSILRKLCE